VLLEQRTPQDLYWTSGQDAHGGKTSSDHNGDPDGELDEKLESRMDGSRLSVDCEEDRLVPLTVSLQGSELQGIIISDGSFSLE